MRSSSVAGDPHSERLQCSLSPLSLLGMLKDLYAKYDAALGANPTVSTLWLDDWPAKPGLLT